MFCGNCGEGTFRTRVARSLSIGMEQRAGGLNAWCAGGTGFYLWENDIKADARSPSPGRGIQSADVAASQSDSKRLSPACMKGARASRYSRALPFMFYAYLTADTQGRIYRGEERN